MGWSFAEWLREEPKGILGSAVQTWVISPKLHNFDRQAFFVAQEMQRWAQATPTPSPEDLVSWGTAWVLRGDAGLSVWEARVIALSGYRNLASAHVAVADVAELLTLAAARTAADVYRQRTGRDPTGIEEKFRWMGMMLELVFVEMSALINAPKNPFLP